MSSVRDWLGDALGAVLDSRAGDLVTQAREEVRAGPTAVRFGALLGRVGQAVRGVSLDLGATPAPLEHLAGWQVQRWTAVDAARNHLVLELAGLDQPEGAQILEEAFRYADEGELVSLYRGLFLAPTPERFLWRAGEGARTNMLSVFEAVVCDGPYPVRHFDDLAWKQALLKSLFVGAKLSDVHGIDSRLSPDLSRMALDYADERRSAKRSVPSELWMLLGTGGGQRAVDSLMAELASHSESARGGAILGLARAGQVSSANGALEGDQSEPLRTLLQPLLGGDNPPTSAAYAGLAVLSS